MAGHDEHGLVDQAETTLLHDRGGDRERLAGADGVGDVSTSGGDDAPDCTLLVPVERKGARGARKLEMRPVEMTGNDVVESVVVEPRQAVGPIRIGPDPGLECALDLGELLLGCLGLDRVEDAPLAVALLHGVEDLRD